MPTTYAVTGANGQLGRLVVTALLDRDVPASEVVAVVRTPARAVALAERGVRVREGDCDHPETLAAGVDRLLLVSGDAVGQRVRQHEAVVDAARAAGVQRIACTSILRAATSTLPLAPEHQATEDLPQQSGVPCTLLRNSWYVENDTDQVAQSLERGEIVGAAGEALVAAAPRGDYAAAAAAALLQDGHQGSTYELGGSGFTFPELAAVLSEVTGRPVRYRDVSLPELRPGLLAAGLDEGTAAFVTGLEAGIAAGELDTSPGDLERVLGRPATPLATAVRSLVL